MLPEERAFPRFARDLTQNLYRAMLSDPNVFLLAVSGLLLGNRGRRDRGVGTALALYVTFRRLDSYIDVGVQIARLFAARKDQQ